MVRFEALVSMVTGSGHVVMETAAEFDGGMRDGSSTSDTYDTAYLPHTRGSVDHSLSESPGE